MSPNSWRASLQTVLSPLSSGAGAGSRLAVIGIGQELCGDDGAGCAVIQSLQERRGPSETFLALDGGCAPENQTGPLRRFRPSLVVLVDAAQMGIEPGSIA